MKAVLLAAGFATRLYPLTRDRAKPLLEVGGRCILDHLLDRMQSIETLDEVAVVCNQRFHSQFNAWAQTQGYRPWPIHLINDGVTDDRHNLGALRDLQLVLQDFSHRGGDTEVLVAAGDNLLDHDLAPYADAFATHGEVQLVLRRMPLPVPPARYNEVEVDKQGRVVSFREKPADPKSDLASICLYFFPAGIGQDLNTYLEGGGNHDAPGYFLEWLTTQRSVRGTPLQGGWHDIGNLQTLQEARRSFGDSV